MFEVSISGITELTLKFKRLQEALDVADILDESQAIMLNRIRTRFLAETDPDGVPWPQSAAAAKRRAGGYTKRDGKKYYATGTLFETGTLFHSIQAYRVDENTRGIGTDVPYGKYHQLGTVNLPVRKFLGFNQEDLTIMEARVVQRIKEAMA